MNQREADTPWAGGGTLPRPDHEPLAYFDACRDLRSDEPGVRKPAIATLIVLARQAAKPIKDRAILVLTREFGPFAATAGVDPCVAPMAIVYRCDAEGWDCRPCKWLWKPPGVGEVAAGSHALAKVLPP